ncbi:hypothetical protein Ancab_008480 [Ancistrocladus abbreviatus]
MQIVHGVSARGPFFFGIKAKKVCHLLVVFTCDFTKRSQNKGPLLHFLFSSSFSLPFLFVLFLKYFFGLFRFALHINRDVMLINLVYQNTQKRTQDLVGTQV